LSITNILYQGTHQITISAFMDVSKMETGICLKTIKIHF